MADSADDEEVKGGSISTLLSPLVINFIIMIGVILVFVRVIKRYAWCYQPRLARPNAQDTRKPPPIVEVSGRSPFAWIWTVFTMSEETLLETVGLDAAMYLRFFQLGVKFFTPLAVIGVVLLLPLNLAADPLQEGDAGYSSTFSLNELTMSNVRKGSHVFWAHLLFAYASTAFLMYLLHQEYQTYMRLRHRYHLSPQSDDAIRPEQVSVMIEYIPESLQTQSQFEAFMKRLYPTTLVSAKLVYDRAEMRTMLEEREAAVHSLEAAVATLELKGVRAQVRAKLGSNEKVDAIEHWTSQIEKLNKDIDESKTKPSLPTPTGFVTLSSFESVASASQIRQTLVPQELETSLAPEPRGVFWPNLGLTMRQRDIRGLIILVAMYFLVAFWFVPVAAISALTTLEKLESTFPFLGPVLDLSPAIKGFLQGFLPSLALLLFQILLPPILLFMSKFEGFTSISALEHSVFSKFFLFQFFAFFLFNVISTSLFGDLKNMSESPGEVPGILSNGLAGQGTTFMAYILLQSLATLPMRLLRIGPLVVGSLKLKYLVKTPHQAKLATDPGPFRFGDDYPMQLFVFLLGSVYAAISPLILPFTCAFFLVGTVVFRFLLCFVHEQQYESGGRLFPRVFARIIVGAIVGQLTLIGMFGLRIAPIQSTLTLPLPVITYLFYKREERNYGEIAERLCRDEVVTLDKTSRIAGDDPALSSAYTEPCLTSDPVNVEAVKATIVRALPKVKALPSTPAVKDLVQLDNISEKQNRASDIEVVVSDGASQNAAIKAK